MIDLISLGSWQGWVLLAIIALIVEFLAPTFIFLSLAVALVILGALAETVSPTLPTQLVVGSVLWVVLSLVLRKLFGNWGKTDAVEDPNQYDRGSEEKSQD